MLEQPHVEINVLLDRTETMVADEQERGISRQLGFDCADAAIERLPEFDEPGPKCAQFAFATAAGAVREIPGVPQLVL